MLSRGVLRQLMGQAAAAGSLETVYHTALRCVQDELNVDRASLLVLDASRTMRFVAWSGLSEAYRRAVDGHSPWRPDEANATPVLVSDVERDAELAAYRPTFRREQIRAIAFVPLQFGSTLLGKFVLYYAEPHAFGDEETALAQRIADHVAFALEHHRISVALDAKLSVERELRQHAEAESIRRQTSESRLRLALAAGHMGAWDWDIGAGRVQWSEEIEALHGLAPGTFDGTLEAFRRDIHPADVERVESTIARAIDVAHGDYHIEYRITRPDSAVRWMAAHGRVLVDGTGRATRMVGVCSDVTERRLAEESAREANRRKDDFLATLAHELRNPLAPLRAGVAVIRRASSDPGTVEQCAIMERQLRQLTRLVDDLLDVSDLTHRGMRLERRRVDLDVVVRTALEQSRTHVDEAGHALLVTMPDDTIVLDADPVRVAQVLTNLVGNAAKYTPRGGRIEVAVARQGTGVRVSVRDNGLGIPPDKLETIFEMFGRLDRSLETGYRGLGIGLTLARALVRLHGGTIEARSEGLGTGSEFHVWLPVADETGDRESGETPAPAARPADTGPWAARRVLIVDDNRDVARSMALWVQLLGHDVRVAFDGVEALEIAEQVRPDVVLLDIGLPKLNGYDVARAMRATSWGAATTLVAVTGWDRESDRRQSQESGFDRHLTKPVEPDLLEALLGSQPAHVEPRDRST